MSVHEFSREPMRDRWFLGTYMHFHATAEDSGGAVTVVEQAMAEGFSPPRHVHVHECAVIVVLEGALTVEIGGERRKVLAFESAFLPRGIPHTFRADAPTRILEITTPGGIDAFYAENGVPAEHGGLPEPTTPDLERLTTTARRRDIEILGPPLDG
jgi:quercetin dioxygenase-like cupin family protein